MKKIKITQLLNTLLLCLFVLTSSCGKSKMDPNRPLGAEGKRQKNIQEGRGVTLGGLLGNAGGTNYEFSTSNPMWRASLETLDFLPLTTVDYSGGVIITDWYSQNGSQDSIKLTIRFLSNEIRADALKIKVFSKECEKTINCKISQSNPKIENELKVAILKRAAKYKKDMIDSNPKRDLNSILTPGDKN